MGAAKMPSARKRTMVYRTICGRMDQNAVELLIAVLLPWIYVPAESKATLLPTSAEMISAFERVL
jgi:hypothetical protein